MYSNLYVYVYYFQTTFASTPEVCEVGDLSGKYGALQPESATTLVYKASYADKQGPLPSDFKLAGVDLPTEGSSSSSILFIYFYIN